MQDTNIDPAKEVIREYFRVIEELNVIRKKFFQSMNKKQDRSTRTYAATLKDYRSIQVRLLQTLAQFGVKNSDDDLVKLLSDLPEIVCKVDDCKCAYHSSIKRIIEAAG